MTDATAAYFEELGKRGHEPMLEKVKASMRFDVASDGKTERWLVTVDRGDIAVSRRNAKADCVLRADRTLFEKLATGEVNAMAAVLRGAIGVEGEPALVVLFQRLLPGPAASRERRGAAGPARRPS